ncbi:hypothetical protein BGZ52_005309 [Haplosporangium bisporale]|nr:hypothetical protein BGZ52_005309 [Haplosporangium bisporale]KAF9200308.1 hypothetical protein BGZ59_003371 [Podila verticillata]KAI9234688.1 MAG: hypothetical protein BYD32DRAFT_422913 [Podila humilis]KFH68889.1 hypothetical protein MVEG_05693 [Podila verticillata NRRL 6337]
MHFQISALMAQAMLCSLIITPALGRPVSSQDLDTTISAVPSNRGKVYEWEIDNFPSSIAKLTKPLHLLEPLQPGKSAFDIARDPISSSKSHNKQEPKRLQKRKPAFDMGSNERILRSLYPAHSYARSKDVHSSFVATPLPNQAFTGPKSRFIRLEYQMLFQPGFNWVKGGKLPGILSGSEQGCNAGCSGGGSAENCFSTRMMWRANGEGELYLYAAKSIYFPNESPNTCRRSLDRQSPESLFGLHQEWLNADRIPGDDEDEEAFDEHQESVPVPASISSPKIAKRAAIGGSCLKGMKVTISPGAKNICNPSYGISIGRGGDFKFHSGTWHNVTQLIKINSKGKAVRDGYLAVYLDNKVVIRAENLVLLKDGYDPSKSQTDAGQVKFMFSSFFGGGSSDYATPVDQWIGWKDFKMASSPVNIWE